MLPAGWTEYKDPTSGNPYYHNTATGETTWTRPAAPGGMPPMGMPQPGGFQQPMQGMDGMQAMGQAAAAPGGRIQGIVKNWNDEKGFGFVDPVGGGENVFIHRSALTDGSLLVPGQPIEYELGWNAQKNKYQAYKITGAQGAAPGMAPAAGGGMSAPGSGGSFGGAGDGLVNSGTVKVWFEDKGFGFITPADGSNDCYVHRTCLSDGTVLVAGNTVQFTLEWNAAKNKYTARNVTGCSQAGGDAGAPMGMPGMGAPMGQPGMGAPMMGDPMGAPGMMGGGGFGAAPGGMGAPGGGFEPYPGAGAAPQMGGFSGMPPQM